MNLEGNGPADGKCGKKDKWMVLGDVFGLPSKCVCFEHPKGEGDFVIISNFLEKKILILTQIPSLMMDHNAMTFYLDIDTKL